MGFKSLSGCECAKGGMSTYMPEKKKKVGKKVKTRERCK